MKVSEATVDSVGVLFGGRKLSWVHPNVQADTLLFAPLWDLSISKFNWRQGQPAAVTSKWVVVCKARWRNPNSATEMEWTIRTYDGTVRPEVTASLTFLEKAPLPVHSVACYLVQYLPVRTPPKCMMKYLASFNFWARNFVGRGFISRVKFMHVVISYFSHIIL